MGTETFENVAVPISDDNDYAKYQIAPSLKEKLVLLDNGKLLVSKSHQHTAEVIGFLHRLKRQDHHFEQFLVDMQEIKAIYEGSSNQANRETFSEMQQFATAVFNRAAAKKASDIHIRVHKYTGTEILFRVHGDVIWQEEHSYEFGFQLCTAIYQAMADVASSTYRPLDRQDARISNKTKIPKETDGVRVGTSPQVDGQIMVLRLLYSSAGASLDPHDLGYLPEHVSLLEIQKKKVTGINLIGGPTGSGKTTTLQRLLVAIHRECGGRKHIITVEDPPELPIEGAIQTPVTNAETMEERSRQFQAAIAGAMRLDPDIMMIGELRDGPTARSAFQGAMTGHQIYSTVHANSALAIVGRLLDLGIPLSMVTDPEIVTGLTCQRLVKVLCDGCKVKLTDATSNYSASDIARIRSIAQLDKVYVTGCGCDKCGGSGVVSRTVVAEVINTNQQLMNFIKDGDMPGARQYWRTKMNGISMLDHAIMKVRQGIVDPFQAEDVVGPLAAGVNEFERDHKLELAS